VCGGTGQEAYNQGQLRLAEERKKLMDEKDAVRVAARDEQRRSCPYRYISVTYP